MPDAYKLNMMIRSSIIALNQANETSNYSVLLDLGAPAFRASNTSGKLAQIFSELRSRDLDLSPILFFTPKLVRQPSFTETGILRLTGYFATAPERINFDLFFQMVRNEWQLFGIGVTTSPADVTAALPDQTSSDTANGGQSNSVNAASNSEPVRALNAPPPPRRPEVPQQAEPSTKASAANGGLATTVENRTTSNSTRIDLSKPQPEADRAADDGGDENNDSSLWKSFNPFSSN